MHDPRNPHPGNKESPDSRSSRLRSPLSERGELVQHVNAASRVGHFEVFSQHRAGQVGYRDVDFGAAEVDSQDKWLRSRERISVSGAGGSFRLADRAASFKLSKKVFGCEFTDLGVPRKIQSSRRTLSQLVEGSADRCVDIPRL
jgi:hypothetical protein